MTRRVSRSVNWTLRMGETSRAAAHALDRQGIAVPIKPRIDLPELPEDLTEEDDSALMSLFVRLTQWTEYIGAQLATAEVDEKFAAASLERNKALSAVANKSEKTVTAAKAKAYEDPEFIEAQEAYHAAYAFRKLTESVYNATDRKAQVVSRELTRRVGRNDRDNRSSRWGGS